MTNTIKETWKEEIYEIITHNETSECHLKLVALVESLISEVEALVRREVLEEVEREVDKLRGVTDRHMTEEQYNDVHQSNAFINHISTIINNLRVK